MKNLYIIIKKIIIIKMVLFLFGSCALVPTRKSTKKIDHSYTSPYLMNELQKKKKKSVPQKKDHINDPWQRELKNDQFYRSLREKIEKKFGVQLDILDSIDTSESGFNWLVKKYAKNLIPILASKYKLNEYDLNQRIKNIKTIFNYDVNGFVSSTDDWKTFEISMNTGLLIFLHKIIKIFSIPVAIQGEKSTDTKIDFELAVNISERLLKAFWEGNIFKAETFDITESSKFKILLSSFLLQISEHFCIAHELGHVYINWDNRKKDLLVLTEKIIEYLPDEVKPTSKEIQLQWAKEIAADIIGLNLVTDYFHKDKNPISDLLSIAGIELVFLSQTMLARYYNHIYKESLDLGTHPPGHIRLLMLRLVLKANNASPQIFELSKAFEELSNVLMTRILRKSK